MSKRVVRGVPMKWLSEHAATVDDGACLIWPFARFPDGRAHMRAGKPARIMCEMAHGPAPSDKHRRRPRCGKAHDGCVHPQHLRWATAKENAADKVASTGLMLFGEAHYWAKLTDSQRSANS